MGDEEKDLSREGSRDPSPPEPSEPMPGVPIAPPEVKIVSTGAADLKKRFEDALKFSGLGNSLEEVMANLMNLVEPMLAMQTAETQARHNQVLRALADLRDALERKTIELDWKIRVVHAILTGLPQPARPKEL